jgi:signal transduction histidine kinase
VLQGTVRLLKVHGGARSPEKLERSLDMMERNVERIIAITQQLERIARVGTDVDDPSTQQINVSAMAAEVSRQLREMAAARGVEVEIAPDLPSITADAARLELVFVNLISNGIKYSDPAKPRRFIAVAAAPAKDGWCAFTVGDNGLGMPADRVQGVFTPFVRAHAERDEELAVEGMGLGLSIVRECLDAMGGSISIESAEGQGTTFMVTLPVA